MSKFCDLLTENQWKSDALTLKNLLTYFWCISDQAYVDGSYYEDTSNEAGFLEAATKSLEQTWSDMSSFFWKTIDEGMNFTVFETLV